MNIAQLRLQNQGLIQTKFSTVREVVEWFGAIQAQDYLASMWAIGLRLPDAITEEDIKQALAERRIVRTWPMRSTIHYVPAEDAWWMTQLLARRSNTKFKTFLDRLGLTTEVMNRARDVLVAALQGNKQLTRKELYAALEQAGIQTASRGLHIITYWAQEGLLCFGPHQGKQPTFALLAEWVPHPRLLEGDDALKEIARRYFTSHGPATIQDFMWWTGLSAAEARAGLDAVKQHFVSHEQAGKTYWFSPDLKETPGASTLLLPCFDEYTVAYKDRSAAVASEKLREYGYGINNNIVSNGLIIGEWKRTQQKDKVTITLKPHQPLTPTEKAALEAHANRYGTFLGSLKPTLV